MTFTCIQQSNIGLNAPGIAPLGIIGSHYFKYKALEDEKNNRCNWCKGNRNLPLHYT